MSSSTAISPGTATRALFLAVCGASGIGKTSFVDALVTGYPARFRRAKSVTTRPRRAGEGDAEYDFAAPQEFEQLLSTGRLLNSDLVHGNNYGISAEDVAASVSGGLIPVKEMAPLNVAQLRGRGLEPLIVDLQSLEAAPVRIGRESRDFHELGQVADAEIPSVRILREGQDPEALAAAFVRWFDATLALGGLGGETSSLSGAWDAENRAGYDRIASEFTDELRVTTAFFHHLSQSFWGRVRSRLRSGGSYLEVAPGRGWLADHLAWRPEHGYRGLELSAAMRALNNRAEAIDLGTASAMPYQAATFDGVLGSLVDPFLNASFLAEAFRVIRPGGWLAFTTPAAEWARALRGEAGVYETTFVTSDGSPCRVGSACCSTAELREALRRLGFDAVYIQEEGVAPDVPNLPPAVGAALDRRASAEPLAVVTTCLAEKVE